jgi:hypothetical protein
MLHPYHKIIGCLALVSAAGLAGAVPTRTHFLDYGPSAGASGMGEANIAYALDAGAIYHNPALIYNIRDQVTASHWFLYDGARYNFIGVVANNERSAFGLAGTQFYRDNIEARQSITDPGTIVQNDQMAVYGTYAGRLAGLRLNYGVNLKWIKYAMGDFTANGISSDVGLSRSLFNRTYSMGKKLVLNAGLVATNIYQTGITMDTEKENVPMGLKAGFSALTTLWPKYNRDTNKLTYDNLAGEIDLSSKDGVTEIGGGAQYTLLQVYRLRAGYSRGITAGFGYQYGDIVFDYAFMVKALSNFHRIGFSYNFGKAETTESTMPITDDFQKVYQKAQRVYERFVRNAEELMKQERQEDARLLLIKAIPLNPDKNGPAKDLLKVCDLALQARRTAEIIAKANELLPTNLKAAHALYLDVYKITADLAFLNTADEIAKKEPALGDKRKAFIEIEIGEFNTAINANDYARAEKQLQIIRPLVGSAAGEQMASTLTDRRGIHIGKLVAKAMEYLQKEDYIAAYKYFAAAHQLSEDAGIKDQMKVASEKYHSKKKRSVEDNIYADKLYYKMVYNFATDDAYQVIKGELISFSPFYDMAAFDGSLVELGKAAPEILPVE